MKKLRNILFFGGYFFLFAGAIYRLCMTSPPLKGQDGYELYQCLSVLAGVWVSGLYLLTYLLVQKMMEEQEDDENS